MTITLPPDFVNNYFTKNLLENCFESLQQDFNLVQWYDNGEKAMAVKSVFLSDPRYYGRCEWFVMYGDINTSLYKDHKQFLVLDNSKRFKIKLWLPHESDRPWSLEEMVKRNKNIDMVSKMFLEHKCE
jgi:hypothetical protein